MSARSAQAKPFAAVRGILRARRDRPSGGDVAYAAYLSIMLAIIVAVPVVRAVVLWLAEALQPPSPATGVWLLGVVAGVLLGSFVLGGYAGPIRARLPEVDLLLTSALPRARLLGPRLLRTALAAGVGGAGIALVCFGARVLRGEAAGLDALGFAAFGAAVGAGCVAAATAGQVLRGAGWQQLRDQAQRVDAVGTMAATGDLRAASTRLASPIRFGRRWVWRVPRRAWARMPARDLLGVLRTPLRSCAAGIGLLLSGTLLGAVLVHADSGEIPVAVTTVGGAAAAVLGYASIGPWCRGLRAAAESVGAPALYPHSPGSLLGRHLVVPGTLAVAVGSAGCAGLLAAGIDSSSPLFVIMTGALFGAVAVALRLLGALKGPLPQRLLAPIPSPVGDLAGMNILLWALDAPIWSAVIGGLCGAAAGMWSFAPILVALFALTMLGLWAIARLRIAANRY